MYLYELLGWLGAICIGLALACIAGDAVDRALKHRGMKRRMDREYREATRRG